MNRSALKRAGLLLFLGVGIPLLLSLVSSWRSIGERLILLIAFVGIPSVIMFYGLQNRKVLTCLNLALCVALTAVSGFFTYRPNGLTQMVLMLLFLGLIVTGVISIVAAFVYWAEHEFGALVPLAVILLGVVLLVVSNRAGHGVRSYVFERRLPQYEQAVRIMAERTEDGRVSLRGEEVPAEYRHLGHNIFAERTEQDVLIVTFIWGYGFPASAVAFEYTADGLPSAGRTTFHFGWTYRSRINENWFRVGG